MGCAASLCCFPQEEECRIKGKKIFKLRCPKYIQNTQTHRMVWVACVFRGILWVLMFLQVTAIQLHGSGVQPAYGHFA